MGKRSTAKLGAIVGELTPEDLKELNLPRPEGLEVTTPPLARIKHSHHMLARLLAAGKSNTEAGFLTGFSPSRISILKADPSFQELLSFYTTHNDEVFADIVQNITTITYDALQEIHERLLTTPESVSTRELLELVSSNLDRLGHGAVQKHHHTVAVGSVSQLKAAADAAHNGTVHVLNRTPERPAEGGPLGLNRDLRLTVEEGQILGESSQGDGLSEEGEQVLLQVIQPEGGD